MIDPVKCLPRRKLDESSVKDDFSGTPEQHPIKKQRVGEGSSNNSRPLSEKRPRRRGEFDVDEIHLGNMTVGESWPEKRNVVIIGSEDTSIPLFCQADMERCALEEMSSGKLVDILPGTVCFLHWHYSTCVACLQYFNPIRIVVTKLVGSMRPTVKKW